MTRTALIALWSWFRNHPAATFKEFSDAFDRANRIGLQHIDEGKAVTL